MGREVAGRGFVANVRATTCVFNFAKATARGKIVRETPTFPSPGKEPTKGAHECL